MKRVISAGPQMHLRPAGRPGRPACRQLTSSLLLCFFDLSVCLDSLQLEPFSEEVFADARGSNCSVKSGFV